MSHYDQRVSIEYRIEFAFAALLLIVPIVDFGVYVGQTLHMDSSFSDGSMGGFVYEAFVYVFWIAAIQTLAVTGSKASKLSSGAAGIGGLYLFTIICAFSFGFWGRQATATWLPGSGS